MADPAGWNKLGARAIRRPRSLALAPALEAAWARHGRAILVASALAMAGIAAGRLARGFWRLLLDTSRAGAIDLLILQRYVDRWFAAEASPGLPVISTYPPASHLILWPLIGWLDAPAVRWFWALTVIAAAGWLIILVVRESDARQWPQRVFVALLPLAITGSSVAIGNGQLIYHILPPLLAGLILITRRSGWWTDVAGAGLLAVALVKPSVTVPFAWIALFAPRRLRPAALLATMYAALTVGAALFRPDPVTAQIRSWLGAASAGGETQGYANVHNWLSQAGRVEWSYPAATLILLAFGGWVYSRRFADLWVLVGAAALVARLWTNHFVYDDVMVLLALIALYRFAARGPAGETRRLVAGALLGLALLPALAPARLVSLAWPWGPLYEVGQTVVWAAMLLYFLTLPAPPVADRAPGPSVAPATRREPIISPKDTRE